MYRSTAVRELVVPADQGRVPAAFASFLPILIVVLAALLLAGCAQAPSNLASGNLAAAGKTKKAATTIAASEPDAADAANAPAAAKKEKSATPTIWQTADKLMGLESEAVRAALGAPARIRDEETARIYQYIGGDCVLDLFLYQADGSYRVTYAEARSASAETKPVDVCLKSLPAPLVAANTQPST